MKLSEFDFKLPEELIAQQPAPERDQSRMMVVWRKTGKREHRVFRELPDILGPEHFLVVNDTRVFPARLRASRPGKTGAIEVLLVKELNPTDWLALIKPGRKTSRGQELTIGDLTARVVDVDESGRRVLRFNGGNDLKSVFEKIGEPPTPPYIRRGKNEDLTADLERYQTIYARHSGSVAAPTAGLHFTDEVFRRLEQKGIAVCNLLLHVGYGTFQPVRCEEIEKHRMEPEHYQIDQRTASTILGYKAMGRRLIAVGTTTTRCLEFLAGGEEKEWENGKAGSCNLFIYPGFQFRMIDGLITNFHLPKSTLFMLVSAFAGRELMLDCYREAISSNYRFFSYGDCMLIL